MAYLPPQISPRTTHSCRCTQTIPLSGPAICIYIYNIYIYVYFQIILGQRNRFSFHILLLSVTRTVCGLLSSSSESLAGWWFFWTAGCKFVCKFRLQEVESDLTRKSQIEQKHAHTHVHLHTQISDLSGPCWGLFGMNRL